MWDCKQLIAISRPLTKKNQKRVSHPNPSHALSRPVSRARTRIPTGPVRGRSPLADSQTVHDQPHCRRKAGLSDVICESIYLFRNSHSNRSIKNLFRHFNQTLEQCASSSEDDPARKLPLKPRQPDALVDVSQHLLGPWLDNIAEQLPRHRSGLAPTNTRHLNQLIFTIGKTWTIRTPVLALDPLSLGNRRSQPECDVISEVTSTNRKHRSVCQTAPR